MIRPTAFIPRLAPYLRNFRWRRRAERTLRDETLERRALLYGAALLLGALSLPLHAPLLLLTGLLLLALAAVPELWYRFGLRGLRVERRLATRRALFGDVIEARLTVENRSALPLPWLALRDELPAALPTLGQAVAPSARPESVTLPVTLSLWAYQRVRRRTRLWAVARGAHRFGPTTLRLCDPFGLLTREGGSETGATLLVHPLVAPLERFGLPPRAPFGERRSDRRLLDDPLRIAGARPYTPGDEPRRIHWKATARTGALQSKVYEPSSRQTLVIFLDVRTYTHPGMGYDADRFELAVSAAASVARWGLDHGYAVGLFSNGTLQALDLDPPLAQATPGAETASDPQRLALAIAQARARLQPRAPASARPEQLARILDDLARLVPYTQQPMSEILLAERRLLPLGATVVYIGAEAVVDVPLLLALRQARAGGASVTLLLTTDDEEDQDEDSGPARREAEGDRRDDDSAVIRAQFGDLPARVIGGRRRWRALEREALDLAGGVGGVDADEVAATLRRLTGAAPHAPGAKEEENDANGYASVRPGGAHPLVIE